MRPREGENRWVVPSCLSQGPLATWTLSALFKGFSLMGDEKPFLGSTLERKFPSVLPEPIQMFKLSLCKERSSLDLPLTLHAETILICVGEVFWVVLGFL